jgi:hypothetical protein
MKILFYEYVQSSIQYVGRYLAFCQANAQQKTSSLFDRQAFIYCVSMQVTGRYSEHTFFRVQLLLAQFIVKI